MPLTPGIHHFTPSIPLHVFQADQAGPTAVIQAGIHGDEVAGVHALAELLEAGFGPARGRLVVVPVMNPPAYRARQRTAPGGLDLNRCFPGDVNGATEERLAKRFMDLVLDEQPALVATLHESQKRYDPAITPSFGQSIVYGVNPMPGIVQRTVDRLNRELADDNERWAPLYYPVPTSSTEVIVEATGCIGVCVETWMGFSERRRIEMQTRVVRLLLDDLGIRPEA
jgi:hypothetical protein